MFHFGSGRASHREGYRQGFLTALLVSSPFIVAGAKWMMENSDPVIDQMKNMKKSDLYTQLFDKEKHEEKKANRKLRDFRAGEGNYDMEASASTEEDAKLFKMMKEITEKEMAKKESE